MGVAIKLMDVTRSRTTGPEDCSEWPRHHPMARALGHLARAVLTGLVAHGQTLTGQPAVVRAEATDAECRTMCWRKFTVEEHGVPLPDGPPDLNARFN